MVKASGATRLTRIADSARMIAARQGQVGGAQMIHFWVLLTWCQGRSHLAYAVRH
jgi:hypothetical protein